MPHAQVYQPSLHLELFTGHLKSSMSQLGITTTEKYSYSTVHLFNVLQTEALILQTFTSWYNTTERNFCQ